MADVKSEYQNGKLNIGPTAAIESIHKKPEGGEKPIKYTGSDLRDGVKSGK